MKKLLLFVMMLFLACGCSKNSDELVMVTEAGFAPYEYYRDGEIVGVDVDIAKDSTKIHEYTENLDKDDPDKVEKETEEIRDKSNDPVNIFSFNFNTNFKTNF